MKVLLLGAGGQLGWELQQTRPNRITLETCDFPKVDFASRASIQDCLARTRPDIIINAAAYTAVDKAEQETGPAHQINHHAVQELARLARDNKIFMVQISTDFVFNGQNFMPYKPDDRPDPKSVYGLSKFKGEQAVIQTLKDRALIIRTAWLYSSHGNNFVKTMLRLMAEKDRLTIIDEQIGTPTWANGLAKAVWKALSKNITGIRHWTDAGVASWYDFALAVQEEAFALNLLNRSIPIQPVPSTAFPTPATRPFYSVLDKHEFWQALDAEPVHWRVQLRSMLKELKS